MKARYYTPEDYGLICEWWDQWGWPHIPEICLPVTGIIIETDKPICAAFLYKTDSAVCWAENYISDKTQRAGECVQYLIECIIKEAQEQGFKALMSSVKNPHLIKKLTNAGFDLRYDREMSNLTRIL